MPDSDVDIEPLQPAPLLADQHIVRRIVDLVAGLVVPGLLLIFLSLLEVFGPEWQSGSKLDFGLLILNGRSLLAFAPFLAYSATCLALVILGPQRFAHYGLVRFGVYSGLLTVGSIAVLIGLWLFSNLLQSALDATIVAILSLNIVWMVWLVVGRLRWPAWPVLLLLAMSVSGAEAIHILLTTPNDLLGFLTFFPLFQGAMLLFATPWIATLTFARYSRQLVRYTGSRWQLRLSELLGITTWAAGYMAAWRLAYHEALDHYSRLPSSAPSCYIATAAARGHRRFVGAQEQLADDDTSRVVNRQLARLKAAELALLTWSPRLHRAARAVYDRLGPPIARRLQNRWLADAAYLSLKPAEWTSMWLLRRAVPDFDRRVASLFRSADR
jgi:hypothetical protein